MKLIVISPSKSIERETEVVQSLFEHGLNTFHLRKPRMSTKEMRQYIESLPKHFHSRIVIHSHHQLASRYGLRGIHITRHHQKRRWRLRLRLQWMRLQRRQLTLSSSYRSLAGLYEDTGRYDYVFLSPIFESLTGNFHSGYNAHSLRAALGKNPVQVIARGGISAARLEQVKDLGFSGMALYSALWKKSDPLREFIAVLDRCKELGIEVF
jgi:thiamine-phosphate pyrophosphorylase